MGRPKKEMIPEPPKAALDYTLSIVSELEQMQTFCGEYERSHGQMLEKLGIANLYCLDGCGICEPFLQFDMTPGRERELFEKYLESKRRIFLFIHGFQYMDEQMRAVAEALLLDKLPQKCAEVVVKGKTLSPRTLIREKKRALHFIANVIHSYMVWEVEQMYVLADDDPDSMRTAAVRYGQRNREMA